MLIARVLGRPLPEFLAERLFEPFRMVDTGFGVPVGKPGRLSSYLGRNSRHTRTLGHVQTPARASVSRAIP